TAAKPKAELRADRTAVPVGGSVTLTCSVSPSSSSSSSSGWKYYWYYRHDSYYKVVTSPDAVFLSNGQISVSEGGLYKCIGGRGKPVYYTEYSDSVRIDKPRPVLTVSPSWLSPGASVTLNCQVEHPSAGWSFYWYKAVPDLSEKSSSYELLPDGSGTAQDSYIIHGQTHTAGYVCRAGRGDPEYHTDHSQPEFVWSADVHSAASLTVSPDRVQHFTSDSVSLTCEGNFTEWRVRKFSEDGRLSDCRRMTGSTCNIYTSESDTGVYWCESGSGEFSSAVNITVQYDGNGPILVNPVHPVTEGASVSLSCSLRTQKILSNVFFYHNDKLIQ
uniref:Ig-like domain-containing protein n=1 Tax=Oreochromis aureus TaxID=47969 RepID=A0AAZ1Y2R5_OREAU